MPSFLEKLKSACHTSKSLLCVGLDPDPSLMPVSDVLQFNRAIVDATRDLVSAYKPNLAFYEALGFEGLHALYSTIEHIRVTAPGVIILGDGKRGDIASTNKGYAKALFEFWGFDAATVNPYAGGESLEPFLDYEDRGIFIWCRSSNPGAKEFQDLALSTPGTSMLLFQRVALQAAQWNSRRNVGLVVGATYLEELKWVRSACPGMPILIPGLGAQGGELEKAVAFGIEKDGHHALFNASRQVLYASREKHNFAQGARRVAQELCKRINGVLEAEGRGW
ncbi:MAG: orotidine-5'-phosphate decarboxylase [Chloroflexi bacterium]|nr:orotidine-5'-phosphate decarboxylase [Chloroflexota bacterium]